ncbi:MAG: HAD family hydrolase, partial [Promethearchaeota archaeon]
MSENLSFKQLEKKKVIVFDLDGTIVELDVNWQNLRKLLSKKYSKIFNTSRVFDRITVCLSSVLERGDMDTFNEFLDIICTTEYNRIENTKEIETTTHFIKNSEHYGIPKSTKFAILSLNCRKTIKKAINLSGIANKITFIVGREDVTKWKPNPAGLLKIKSHFNVSSAEMVYFGDVKKDLIAG